MLSVDLALLVYCFASLHNLNAIDDGLRNNANAGQGQSGNIVPKRLTACDAGTRFSGEMMSIPFNRCYLIPPLRILLLRVSSFAPVVPFINKLPGSNNYTGISDRLVETVILAHTTMDSQSVITRIQSKDDRPRREISETNF